MEQMYRHTKPALKGEASRPAPSSSPASRSTQAQAKPEAGPNFKVVSGVIERITFPSEDTGYTVARLLRDHKQPAQDKSASKSTPSSPRFSSAKGDDNLITVVGTMPGV